MSCYDIYDMLHDLECGVSINFVFKLLPYLYCDPIYGVTHTTEGVSTKSLARFRGVSTDHMHGYEIVILCIRGHSHN